ncbi:hypothetical protein PVAND_009123 [Polypedilum vanderplanki]|uniref:CRAL-TRIO domain-containing protein n=1 Tax=Polypedilum vanderplanki TaxID=319348 RepID=A0A9J6CCT8_POLVA|nr:hypothetical protein PVAND_009123 [Polypedilum vanderplanki]
MLLMLQRFKEILKSAYNYNEALEREKLSQENVNLLREKLKSSKIVPQSLVDKQLLLFLNACKSDVEKSAVLIENYYKIKRSSPEFFQNRNVESDEIQNCLKNQYYVSLPTTPDNNMLIFHSLKNFDPNSYNFDSAAKTYIMTTEAYTFNHGPRAGVIYLFDLKGLSYRFLFKPSISSMRKGIKFLEEGIPFEIKQVHVFNTVRFFNLIVAIVKPLLNSELLQKLHLHNENINYEEFYKNFVPKTHLPREYGGLLKSVEELHQQNCQNLTNLKDYFIYEEQQTKLDFDQYVDEFLEEMNKI